MEIDREKIKEAAIRKRNYNLVVSSTSSVLGTIELILGELGRINIIDYNEMMQHYSTPRAITFFREVPSHLTLSGYALGLGISTYCILHSLNIYGTFNPQKWFRGLRYQFSGFLDAVKTRSDYTKTIELAKLIGDPILEHRVIATVDFKEGRIDEAFKRSDAVLNAIPYDSIPKPLIWKLIEGITEYAIYLLPPNKRKAFQSENPFLSKAFSYFREGKTEKAKANFEKAIEFENKNVAEINLLYAYFLELIKDKKTKEQFAKTASIIQADPSTSFESLGESKNEVNILSGSNYISQACVIKRNEDLEHLVGEIELIESIRDEVENEKNHLPLHIGEILFREGKYESYIKRIKVDTLLERIDQTHPNLEKNLEDISDFLADIYCAIPIASLSPEQSERPLILERLSHLGLKEDVIDIIVDNLDPVLDSFNEFPLVYCKDPNPKNWGIRKDETIDAFDFEPASAIRLQKDLASLTDMCELADSLKKKVHRRVIERYNRKNKEGILIDIGRSEYAWYNGVLLKAFKAYSVLSIGNSRLKFRRALVKNAKNSLIKMQEEHREEFSKNASEYFWLSKGLDFLEANDRNIQITQ